MDWYCYAFNKVVSYILATITMYVLYHGRGQFMNTNKINESRRRFLYQGIFQEDIRIRFRQYSILSFNESTDGVYIW